MNNPNFSNCKVTNIIIGFMFILLTALALSSCSSRSQEGEASCIVDMDMQMTIDVTDVESKVIFDQLVADPDCIITVGPFVRRHINLHLIDATVSEVLGVVCEKIECKYTYDGHHITISHLNFIDKIILYAKQRNFQAQQEWQKKFEVLMPEDMIYEDAMVSGVLHDISEISGLEFKAWKGEGDQTINVEISGMTVDEALTAVVLQIENSEGIVLVKMWDGRSYGQHPLVDKP